jgi:hypothetical protein
MLDELIHEVCEWWKRDERQRLISIELLALLFKRTGKLEWYVDGIASYREFFRGLLIQNLLADLPEFQLTIKGAGQFDLADERKAAQDEAIVFKEIEAQIDRDHSAITTSARDQFVKTIKVLIETAEFTAEKHEQMHAIGLLGQIASQLPVSDPQLKVIYDELVKISVFKDRLSEQIQTYALWRIVSAHRYLLRTTDKPKKRPMTRSKSSAGQKRN